MAATTPPADPAKPEAEPRKRITVRASMACTSIDCDTGRHLPRDRDEVFDIWSDTFNSAWLIKAKSGDKPPELPKTPPETTLPPRNQPVPVAR